MRFNIRLVVFQENLRSIKKRIYRTFLQLQNMRKAIIIYDNNTEVTLLQDYLKMVPGILIVGVFSQLDESALNAIDEVGSDMIFSSLTVLIKLINSQVANLPLLVCIGPNEEMLSATISKNIFAYLNTPFSYERVLSLIQTAETYMLQLSSTSVIKRDYVFVKSDYKLIKINLSDILFLSGLRDYTQIFLKGKTSPLTTLQNLKDFESKLPENWFIRVHRSYIISLSQVDSISRNEISIGTHNIPIGNAYRQLLDDMITKILREDKIRMILIATSALAGNFHITAQVAFFYLLIPRLSISSIVITGSLQDLSLARASREIFSASSFVLKPFLPSAAGINS